jgi:hypothetical protein
MAKKPHEKTLYKLVAGWTRRHFLCFRVAVNKGLIYSRMDVLGIRDVGGDFSGDVETIAVEVKQGSTPFTNAAGQTVGYRVYANRVYLADLRDEAFNQDELLIASSLGIGLIHIKGTKCREVLSSPVYQPIPKLQLRLFAALLLGKCQLCGSLFHIGEPDSGTSWSKVCVENVKLAIKREKGLMFCNREVGERRAKLGLCKTDYVYDRRFICPECISLLLAPLHAKEE